MRLLVQKGVNVNDSDDFGATPLHFAVFGNYPDIVEELLAARVMILFLNFPNAAVSLVVGLKECWFNFPDLQV